MVDAHSTFMIPQNERNRSGIGGLMHSIGGQQQQQQMFNMTINRNSNFVNTNQNSTLTIKKMAPQNDKN